MPLEINLKPVEQLLFRSNVAAIGSFRCPQDHPLYRDSGPCTHHTFVFPRSFTTIQHHDGRRFMGGPDSVSLYNQNQIYFRTPISNVDASDWYVVADDVLREAIADHDPAVAEHPDAPFRFTHARSDPHTYLLQRQLFEAVQSKTAVDDAWVDETVIHVLRRVVANAYERRADTSVSHSDLDRIEHAKRLIARRVTTTVSLREIAEAVESSPFRLCRIFKAWTGETLTSYRHSLRLRLALERLRDRRADLTDLALDLGYSSHSHFTAIFRRRFGVTPSAVRSRT